jgi:RNA polymerase sigma-70 factor (ECF subfamily)
MEPPDAPDVTAWLQRLRAGDASAREHALGALYGDLRRIAQDKMDGQRANHTLQATALVHEAWIRLAEGNGGTFRDREHFLAVAATAMRHVLVDHARRTNAKKRDPGAAPEPLDSVLLEFESRAIDVLAVHDALEAFAALDPRAANIVEMRFFGGMTMDEIAAHLEVPKRSVERDWEVARAWLRRKLS